MKILLGCRAVEDAGAWPTKSELVGWGHDIEKLNASAGWTKMLADQGWTNTYLAGDAFAVPAALLADCVGVYDRAALVALPPPLRDTYLATLWRRLPIGCRGLLVTLEYPQPEKDGPPFSVDEAEVRAGFSTDWSPERLERRDILADEPTFQAAGVTALSTAVYALRRG